MKKLVSMLLCLCLVLSLTAFAAAEGYTAGTYEGKGAGRNGDIVVALVDDDATVKRFYKENGHFRLQPENDAMEPIIVSEVTVLGKVISLLRRL